MLGSFKALQFVRNQTANLIASTQPSVILRLIVSIKDFAQVLSIAITLAVCADYLEIQAN